MSSLAIATAALALACATAQGQAGRISNMTRATSTTGLNDSARVEVTDSAGRTRASTVAQMRKALSVKAFDSLRTAGPLHATADSATGAARAQKLTTARAINGVNFDGTAAITVPAAAGTLTGSTLASGVTASSLTSTGTLATLTMGGTLQFGAGYGIDAILKASAFIGSYSVPANSSLNLGDITVSGLVVSDGDLVLVGTSTAMNGMYLVGAITAANTVTVYAVNPTSGSLSPGGGSTYYVRVIKGS